MASTGGQAPPDIAEDFGQRVDLTRRIREILANYPEGTTMFKEIIQNADDAGATEVSFCLDRRSHGQDSLLWKELAAWQGPALVAHNNAEFSDDDFASISRLGGSKKLRQPWKTGRFGVGFNSLYHLSDLPSFVSGRHIVYFDPQCRFLPNVSAINPGKRIDFVNSAALSSYKDQFAPYCMFGCDMKTPFQGTLFRLPLRSISQATQSELSSHHYNEKDVSQLFDEFSEEASLCMLFLKNVEVLRLYDWDPGSDSPCMLYSCSVTSAASQIKWHRHALTRLAHVWTSWSANDRSMPKHLDSFELRFDIARFVGAGKTTVSSESFMIVQCMEAMTSRVGALSALAALDYGACLLPWAAVAAKISGENVEVNCKCVNNGKAFCFLPLPLKTNLPIHINGFFELSSNRRDIWHGADMEGMGKIRAEWNSLLLNDVVVSAYHHLLLVAPEEYRLNYTFWPSGSFMEPWKTMVDNIFEGIPNYPVLHSDIDGGQWISLSQAILHDEEMPNCNKQAAALIALRVPLVHMPKHLLQQVSSHPDAKMISPSLLRQHLKMTSAAQIDWDSGLDFLYYCLSDEDALIGLSGVPLVPLATGTFGVFGDKISGVTYFLCDEKQYLLMEKLKDRVINLHIPHILLQKMHQIAESSDTNICFLGFPTFVRLLDEILPAEWKGKDVIQWLPNDKNIHPSEIWIKTLWKYLNSCCKDLTFLGPWPLLPVNNGLLCRLKQSLGIVSNDGSLPEQIADVLINLGCYLVRSDLCTGHSWLSNCAQSPSGIGILDAVYCVALRTGRTYKELFSEIISDHRCALRSFLLDIRWYAESSMKVSHVQILKSLPIFKAHGIHGDREKVFVDLLSSKRYLAPPDVDGCLLGPDFLYAQRLSEIEVLKKELAVHQMQRSTFYKFTVIDKLSVLPSVIRDQGMLSVLKELPSLCLQDPHLKNAMRNLSFVPTPSGELRSPKLLYDPRFEELKFLLNEKDSFPADSFRTEDVLDALQLLGLQTYVSYNTVLQSAHQIELMLKERPEEAIARGVFLLSYLEINAVKLFPSLVSEGINNMFSKVTDMFQTHRHENDLSKRFWNELASICWCPVLVHSPNPGLPWPTVATPIAPPKLVRLPSDLWLASASMRILNGDCRSAFLAEKLGWNSPLACNVLAAQLLELGRNQSYAGSPGFRQALATVIPKIYAILTEKLGTEELEIVKIILEGSKWVWVGDRFVGVHDSVLSGPLHLAPYLWVIPADLAVFKELLLDLGVKETIAVQDFSIVLSKMAKAKSNTPLDSLELKTVIWILQHLVDMGFVETDETLFVPDVSGVLQPASLLAYNDAPWLLGDSEAVATSLNTMIDDGSLPRFVHGNISIDVAERLNIKSLRRLLLAESADSLNLTLHGAAEAFGQHEALTTRLKHIVDMYVDGPGILCELLQNSEDAGSSDVAFLLDLSQYGSSSLLSPRMSDWQGPALYCFNNSVFTTRDMYAISRIGQDSKLEKPHAVGRFGLGFNSVYNFTDIPSFVSGNNLVIFDPHACHLPGISPSHPGLKINFVGRRLVQQFPDQCRPYMIFGCDLQHCFNGTLFRFPLRTTVTAARSQIKQTAYSPEMVLSLFRDFQTLASEVLLFLHNVTSIKLYIRESLDQEMHMLYKVSKHGAANEKPNSVYTFIRNLREEAQDSNDFCRKLQDVSKDCLASDCQVINIVTDNIESQSTDIWIVNEYLGGRKAVSMATTSENRIYGFLPWAGVAAKVGAEKKFTKTGTSIEAESELFGLKVVPLEGRAFCFLPLPVKIGLPVHVNAYFELSSNRRDIWFGDDMTGGSKVRSEWNCCLLKEVACPAYVQMLAYASSQLGPSEEYYSLWPTRMPLEPWASLLCSLYVSAVALDMPVLFTAAKGGRWISPREGVFPDYSYSEATLLGDALTNAGLSLLNAPAIVVDGFKSYCPTLRFLTPQLLRSLLIRRQRALGSRDSTLACLKYCICDIKNSDSVHKLEGLPLIPLATGMFETFNCSETTCKLFVPDRLDFELLKDTNLNILVDYHVDHDLFEALQSIAKFERTNLAILTPDLLKDLLPNILPPGFHGKQLVQWTSGEAGHPSQTWIQLLWRFLCSRSADLSLFTDWPLLPTMDEILLVQLKKGSCVLVGDNWSENMVHFLGKTNCLLLSSSIKINHPQLREYVHDVSGSGLLGALFAAAGGFAGLPDVLKDISQLEMQELRGFLLQKKWFVDDSMSALHIEMLKHLPIFKCYKASALVCLAKGVYYIPPKNMDVHLLGENFLHAESDKEEEILTVYLGIKELGKKEFFENHAFKNLGSIEPDIRNKIILNFLQNVSTLEEEVPSIMRILSQSEIVPTMHGKVKSPTALYDPRVTELHSLLDNSFFPSPDFAESELLDRLSELGLKTSLGLKDLLDSAMSVVSVSLIDQRQAFMMGKCLLDHINKLGLDFEALLADTVATEETSFDREFDSLCPTNEHFDKENLVFEKGSKSRSLTPEISEKLEDHQFWINLSAINWCPVLIEAPIQDLPWPKELNSLLVSPRITRPKLQMWQVSATMRILDGEFSSRLMMSKLGWLEKPNLSILAMQLIELSKKHAEIESEDSLRLEVEMSDTRVKKFNHAVNTIVPTIYSFMEESLTSESALALKSMFDDVCWVWVGDAFVLPTQSAFVSPLHFRPYLHVVPSNSSVHHILLSSLGVKESFDIFDLSNALQQVAADRKGEALNKELLDFVVRVLEAVYEILIADDAVPSQSFISAILVPDSNCFLTPAKDLVYNDAPWLSQTLLEPTEKKRFVNENVPNEIADRLGAKSLRFLSFVDKEMTKNLPCLSLDDILGILSKYGKSNVLFDLLEIADKFKAQRVHVLYDKRVHPDTSILQPNLGLFQGAALTVAFEGAEFTTEEVCNLQLSSSWSRRGQNNYGAGLLSCYSITRLLLLMSKGCLYLFDPSGAILSPSSVAKNKSGQASSAQGKVYTLQGTDIPQRFADQLIPFELSPSISWDRPKVTILRMPLYTESALMDETEQSKNQQSESVLEEILRNFMYHASSSLLCLSSIEAVHLLKWENNDPKSSEFFSVKVDPGCSSLRDPFVGRSTKKFQLSTIFNSSNSATKVNVIDVLINQDDSCIIDKWLVVLSFGCGQTKSLAVDRRFLAYNLSPVAGVAALVSRNGSPPSDSIQSTILCPLPLPVDLKLPVTVLGCFIVSHDGFQHVFPKFSVNEISENANPLILPISSMWNQELIACVCEAYIHLLSESMFVRHTNAPKSAFHGNSQIPTATWRMLSKRSYSLWPMSQKLLSVSAESTEESNPGRLERDWLVKLLVRPMIIRLADLPVWKVHGGLFAKATEGMFLSSPGRNESNLHPPDTVCEFLKEHYKVFAVPWELTKELQDAQLSIKVITPKMVRYLMCNSSVFPERFSVDRYVELLEYSVTDFSALFPSDNNAPDALNLDVEFGKFGAQLSQGEELALLRNEGFNQSTAAGRDSSDIVHNIRRAVSHIGKVVEGLSKEGNYKLVTQKQASEEAASVSSGNNVSKWINELKGIPCPTAANSILRLGKCEAWLGSQKQQNLLMPLAANFIHTGCLDRPLLSRVFENTLVQRTLDIKPFTTRLLSDNMPYVLPRQWPRRTSKWVEWSYRDYQLMNRPTREWVCLFWEHVGTSTEELSLFEEWPLLPCVLESTVLVKLRFRQLIFMPPKSNFSSETIQSMENSNEHCIGIRAEHGKTNIFTKSYKEAQQNYPWLFPFLQRCKVPIFDENFLDSEVVKTCLPADNQTLCQVIRSKLLAAKENNNLVVSNVNMEATDCEALFSLFANEFCSASSVTPNWSISNSEIELLRSLPIHKTTIGTYTSIDPSVHFIVKSAAIFKPQSVLYLQHFPPEQGELYYKAMGIQELSDSDTLVRFYFPMFGDLSDEDQERVLSYMYTNWEDLQNKPGLVDILMSTRFVSSREENKDVLFKPPELLDPTVPLFEEVFRGNQSRFPASKFTTTKWLAILQKAGLHSTLDAEALLDCAKEVEAMGRRGFSSIVESEGFNEVSTDVFSTACHVVEAILANFASLYGSSFCEPLSDIAFIPAEMGLPSRNGSGRRVLATFKQVVLLKDWPLAWTSAPTLTNKSLMPPEFLWHSLHLKSPPQLQICLKHIQNVGEHDGEDILARWPSANDIMTVDDAFLEILKYLEKQWNILSSEDKLLLKKIPFIPVANGTRLCLASRIFLRLEMNLAPFAFQLSNSYLPFVELLTELGMQESPTFLGMQALLHQLQDASGYERLNPNELSAVMKILKYMNKFVKSNNQGPLGGTLIVPDDAGRLLHASACVYIDASARAMLGKIDASRLRFIHPHVCEDHCAWLGVRKLSEVVMEVLDESLPLEYVDTFGNISKDHITEKLRNECFQLAIWRLLQDFSREMPNVKPLSQSNVAKKLLWLSENLVCVQQLKTRFLMVHGNIDITINKKGIALDPFKYEFIDIKNGRILLAKPPDYIMASEILSVMLSKVLDNPVCLPFSGLFDVASGAECQHMEIMRLRPCQNKEMKPMSDTYQDIVPGDELSKSDATQIQLHPLRPYYSGEIVAWRLDFSRDSKLKYGIITEDVRAPAGQAIYYLKVKVGPGQIENLLSSNVFSFGSVIIRSKLQGSPRQHFSSTQPPPSVSSLSLPPSETGKFAKIDDFSNSSSCSQQQKGLPQNVNAEAVVTAVNDMMSAVGFPLTLDQRTLLNQALTLQEQLKAVQKALSLEHERADKSAKEAEAARASWMCRICLGLEVNSVLVPCGHVLCRNCSSAVARCPFCRQIVTDLLNLYRP